MAAKLSTSAREKLRQQLKRQRNSLSQAEINRASRSIAEKIRKSRLLTRKKRIAVYLAMPGEVDCKWIISEAIMRKMRVFAPVLFHRKLIFAPLEKHAKFTRNRFGVAEPVVRNSSLISARNLDAVIVPLLGFDKDTNRIGMGGGYYDRSFAFRKFRHKWRHPLLIGVAYSFQQVDSLPIEPWDVPLDVVVTEHKLLENL